ncbi:MAG: selenium cofactor biosynthesis protein YqeC [Thermodesulfobacteriota bacterium]
MYDKDLPLSRALMLRDSGVVSIVGAGGKTTLMFRLARELSGAGQRVLTTTTTRVMTPSSDQAPFVIVEADPAEVLSKARAALVKDRHVFAASGPYGTQGKLSGFVPEVIGGFWGSGLFHWILVEADGAAQRPLKAPAAHEPVIPKESGWVIAVASMEAIGRPLDDLSVFRAEIYAEITGLKEGEPITQESLAMSILHPAGVMRGSPEGAVRCLFLNKAEEPERLSAARQIVGLLSDGKGNKPSRVVIGTAMGTPPVMGYHDL